MSSGSYRDTPPLLFEGTQWNVVTTKYHEAIQPVPVMSTKIQTPIWHLLYNCWPVVLLKPCGTRIKEIAEEEVLSRVSKEGISFLRRI